MEGPGGDSSTPRRGGRRGGVRREREVWRNGAGLGKGGGEENGRSGERGKEGPSRD